MTQAMLSTRRQSKQSIVLEWGAAGDDLDLNLNNCSKKVATEKHCQKRVKAPTK